MMNDLAIPGAYVQTVHAFERLGDQAIAAPGAMPDFAQFDVATNDLERHYGRETTISGYLVSPRSPGMMTRAGTTWEAKRKFGSRSGAGRTIAAAGTGTPKGERKVTPITATPPSPSCACRLERPLERHEVCCPERQRC
jgi:hypothetical protein